MKENITVTESPKGAVKQAANIARAKSPMRFLGEPDPQERMSANARAIFSELAPQDLGDGNATDTIYAANTARFTEAYFQEPLTQYALGWGTANPAIAEALEFVAPRVPTGRRFEYATGTLVEGVISETDDVRAIGADFKRIEYTSGKTTSRTYNKGLTIRVDMDAVEGMPNWQQVYTGRIMRRLQLNDYRRAVALLKANNTNTAVTWDTTAGKEPDADVLARLVIGNAALTNAGGGLNRVLYGITAWQKRQLALLAQSHAGGFAKAAFTPAQLAAFFGCDGVFVSREVYNEGGAAITTTDGVVDTTVGTTGIVLAFNAQPGMTTEDPSSIKRFVSATPSGDFRVYLQQVSSKNWDLTVEHYSNIAVTSATGIQQLTVS